MRSFRLRDWPGFSALCVFVLVGLEALWYSGLHFRINRLAQWAFLIAGIWAFYRTWPLWDSDVVGRDWLLKIIKVFLALNFLLNVALYALVFLLRAPLGIAPHLATNVGAIFSPELLSAPMAFSFLAWSMFPWFAVWWQRQVRRS